LHYLIFLKQLHERQSNAGKNTIQAKGIVEEKHIDKMWSLLFNHKNNLLQLR